MTPPPPQVIKSCMIVIFSCSSTLSIPFPRTHCQLPLLFSIPLTSTHILHSPWSLLPPTTLPLCLTPYTGSMLPSPYWLCPLAYCKIDICLLIDQRYFRTLYFSGHALVRGSYAYNPWGQLVSSLASQTQPTPVQIISMGREGSGDVMCFLCAVVIGVSLSEPHTSVTALRTCVYMFASLLACLDQPLTINFKWAHSNISLGLISFHACEGQWRPDCVRVQCWQPGAKTTEVEVHMTT